MLRHSQVRSRALPVCAWGVRGTRAAPEVQTKGHQMTGLESLSKTIETIFFIQIDNVFTMKHRKKPESKARISSSIFGFFSEVFSLWFLFYVILFICKAKCIANQWIMFGVFVLCLFLKSSGCQKSWTLWNWILANLSVPLLLILNAAFL